MVNHRSKHGSTCHYDNCWVIMGNGLACGVLLDGFILLANMVMQCSDDCFNMLALGIQYWCSLDTRG